ARATFAIFLLSGCAAENPAMPVHSTATLPQAKPPAPQLDFETRKKNGYLEATELASKGDLKKAQSTL
ncbi:MAG: hypothetical protein ACRELY_23280, partial [Polyangiaceae bacterium]